jgi:L-threonylcarbamoyladenylate synthase
VKTTRALAPDAAGIAAAAGILAHGGLVAFPTETVYGLGANALDASAAAGIFTAKGRPADDPLIVHVLAVEDVARVAQVVEGVATLARRFWPGPLTLVLPKRAIVPDVVTAGLPSVAVRVPAHPVAQALLRATGLPLAAPSANRFGHTSPTRAAHVLADLDGRIDAVLDGGATQVGLESTIVDLASEAPRLLRPGGVAAEDVEEVLGRALALPRPTDRPEAPGMLPTHYAPRTPLILIAGPAPAARDRLAQEVSGALGRRLRVGVLLLEDDRELLDGVVAERVGSYAQPDVSAARLFDALRALDVRQCDVLFARELAEPQRGLGRALADRLRRAATRVIDTS